MAKQCNSLADSFGLTPKTLVQLLMEDSDVRLLFDDNEAVPAHSLTLKQSSTVLATALEAGINSMQEADSDGVITVPMPGTKKDDWLLAVGFLYPVVPNQDVTWDSVRVLVTIGHKYDMPALLSKAAQFVMSNVQQLDGIRTSPLFAWEWITLLDTMGLPAVAQACINAKIQDPAVVIAFNRSLVSGMSRPTLECVMEAVAKLAALASTGPETYCSTCKRSTPTSVQWRISSLNDSFLVECQSCKRGLYSVHRSTRYRRL